MEHEAFMRGSGIRKKLEPYPTFCRQLQRHPRHTAWMEPNRAITPRRISRLVVTRGLGVMGNDRLHTCSMTSECCNMMRQPMKEMDPSRSTTERASRLGGAQGLGGVVFIFIRA